MTENPDPLENAVAERVNGIIKNEYELEVFKSYNELSNYVENAYLITTTLGDITV